MLTVHIRRMLRVAECLAAWCQDTKIHTMDGLEERLIKHAETVGPERTAEFASALAGHAAAELEMERLQARDGWPEI